MPARSTNAERRSSGENRALFAHTTRQVRAHAATERRPSAERPQKRVHACVWRSHGFARHNTAHSLCPRSPPSAPRCSQLFQPSARACVLSLHARTIVLRSFKHSHMQTCERNFPACERSKTSAALAWTRVCALRCGTVMWIGKCGKYAATARSSDRDDPRTKKRVCSVSALAKRFSHYTHPQTGFICTRALHRS